MKIGLYIYIYSIELFKFLSKLLNSTLNDPKRVDMP